MNRIILVLFLSLLLVRASAAEEITWQDCVDEARKNNPELISVRESVKQAEAGVEVAASGRYPTVDGSVSTRTSESDDDRTDSYSYSVSGRQLIFDASKTSHGVNAAREGVTSARYGLDVTSSNVRLGLRTAFVGLLRAQELLTITEEIAERRGRNLELVKLRYEAGKEHRGSLLTAEADLAQADLEVDQAERNIDLARVRLGKELGRRRGTDLSAKGRLEVENSDRNKPDFEKIAETHPFLNELAARKEAARYNVKGAMADFFPSVYLSASGGGSDSEWPPDEDSWSAGLSLSVPIFDGQRRRATVRRNRASLRRTQSAQISGRDSVVLTLAQTWVNYQDAMDGIEVREKFLNAAEERSRIAQAQYSTGLILFDNWIIIEDGLVRARKSYLEAQAAALNAEARWIQAKGGTLEYE